MIRNLVALLLFGLSLCVAESAQGANGTVALIIARDGTRYTNVIITKRDQGRISFQHDDGMTTLSLSAFDDQNLELVIPGHLAGIKAKQAEADAKEKDRERTRDTQRRQAGELNLEAATRAKKEDDIREVAVRYALTRFEPPDLTKVAVIILEIDRDTPSDEFLKRFATHRPPVRKMPRSRRRELEVGELLCSVSAIKWLSDTEVEISASRVVDEEAVSFLYTVRLTDKGWAVVKYKITGIS